LHTRGRGHERHDLREGIGVDLLLRLSLGLRTALKGRVDVCIRRARMRRRIRLRLSIAGIKASSWVPTTPEVLVSSSLASSLASSSTRICPSAVLPIATSWITARAVKATTSILTVTSPATSITTSSRITAPLTFVWLRDGRGFGRRRRRRRKLERCHCGGFGM
jgi:hypothetical protein